MIEFYRGFKTILKYQYNNLYSLIQEIDKLVQIYADMAYNINALDLSKPKQKNWYEKIEKYYYSDMPSLMNAAYGYAIEEMVNEELRANYRHAISGYTISLQETHQYTRPDIVIYDNDQTQIAWLDITSENNKGHIYNKDGSGWTTTKFVAELLYDSFERENLRVSDEIGIGIRAKALSASRKASIVDRNLQEHFKSKMNIALSVMEDSYPSNKSEIPQIINEAFEFNLPGYGKHSAIKSMLKKYLEIFPDSFYSYLVRTILNKFYKNDKQNLCLAMRFISDSYNEEQERNKIFITDTFDDGDDSFLS